MLRAESSRAWLVAAALVALVVAVFGTTAGYGFIAYDDPYYVTDNALVVQGLTWRGVTWALTTTDYFYWHPVTWLSHMLDCELFGLNPHGHHATNILIHSVTTVLVFASFLSLTGRPGRSGVIAALFAVHPLHVEPVAWIAERKELLAGLFWFAGLAAYAWYARRPSWQRFAWVMACLALALASKPVAVTLPFVLLLLDLWPLRRWSPATGRGLLLEKTPLFLMSAASSAITYLGQSRAGAMNMLADVGWSDRMRTAITSYAIYLGDVFWPHQLVPLYPYDRHIPTATVAGAIVLLAAITIWVIRNRERAPFLLVGWLWFAGTLVPTSGLIQVGGQSRADRFMYLPIVGLFMMIVWGCAEWLDRRRYGRGVAIAITSAVIAALSTTAAAQTRYWSDSITLLQHTVSITADNSTAWHNLGVAQAAEGHLEEAVSSYRRSLELLPQNPLGHYNLALALDALNRTQEAAAAYAEAARRHPQYAEAHYGLGAALLQLNRLDEARAELETCLRQPLDDEYQAQAHFRLGLIGAYQGDMPRAAEEFRATLKLRPNFTEAQINLRRAEGK